VPSFVLVLLGAPYVERLRSNRALSSALTGVTAAVVGVIANLALFFAVHTLFAGLDELALGPFALQVPQLGSLQWPALVVTVLALALVFAARWSVLRTLGVCALLGMGIQVLVTVLAR
jgi:chromate transporter